MLQQASGLLHLECLEMGAGGLAEFAFEQAVQGHGRDVEEAGKGGCRGGTGEVVQHPESGGSHAALFVADGLGLPASVVGEVHELPQVEQSIVVWSGTFEGLGSGLLVKVREQAKLIF